MSPTGGDPAGAHGDLVGRDAELHVLQGWLRAAADGAGRFVLASGEAGVGKSRLAEELAARAAAAGFTVLWSRASADPPAPAYWLWQQVLDDDGVWHGSEATGGGLGGPAADRLVLFDRVVRALVATEPEAGGLLVVLDDVQWADAASLQLLLHVVRRLRAMRLLVFATERVPEPTGTTAWRTVAAQLAQEPVAERLSLAGLAPAATVALFTAHGGAPEAAGRVHALTGGNPFYVKELGRSSGAAGERPPDSVLAVVGHRMGTLSAAAQRLLRCAAVLGDRFALSLAADLVGRPVLSCLAAADEAVAADCLRPTERPGVLAFSHGLVRAAVEAGLSLTEQVALHRRAALALESTYRDDVGRHAGDLARHWSVVALTGEREPAVRWAQRAAQEAAASGGYEDAVTWYRSAREVGGPELEPLRRAELVLGEARARWTAGDLDGARDSVVEASQLADRLGRPDLRAESLLVLEAIGDERWDRDLTERARQSLDRLGEDDAALRARLLARMAQAAVYARDYATADERTAEALRLAEASGDTRAEVAALRARQLARTAPEHHEERVDLSRRMLAAGQALNDPATELWGRLWKVDTHWERGEIADIAAELPALDWCADRVGGPVARWQVLVPRAAVAQATARFDEALRVGMQAFQLMSPIQPESAFGAFRSLSSIVAYHVGVDAVPGMADVLPPPPADNRGGRVSIYQLLGPAMDLMLLGDLEAAASYYLRLGPPADWAPEPYFLIPAYVCGSMVAEALGHTDHLEQLEAILTRHRGRHVAVPAGAGSYLAPVELHLGRIAAALGHRDSAVRDLSWAAQTCRRVGALGWATEADCRLAELLASSPASTDRQRAAQLSAETVAAARRWGMQPWAQRAAAVAGRRPNGDGAVAAGGQESPTSSDGLSPREREVAALVAEGLTNRQIAQRLYLSERTAQNHVQHILVKLGFANRSQIASWVVAQGQMSTPVE